MSATARPDGAALMRPESAICLDPPPGGPAKPITLRDKRYELRVGADVFTVDGTSGSVRVRRGTADRPDAALTTDVDTLHAVALGKRSIAETAESGDTCASTEIPRPSAASPACSRR